MPIVFPVLTNFPLVIRDATETEAGVVTLAQISGGGAFDVTTLKTSDYTAAEGEYVQCDPSAGAFNVTLPAAASVDAGKAITVKNKTGSVNNVNVVLAGGDSSDGDAGPIAIPAYTSVTFVSDGVSDWMRS